LKSLESDQSKSGFTGLVLSLGAMVLKWTPEDLSEGPERRGVKAVRDWCYATLGRSIQSQHKQIFNELARNENGMNARASAIPTLNLPRARLRPSLALGW
jgi:hypothetical protein